MRLRLPIPLPTRSSRPSPAAAPHPARRVDRHGPLAALAGELAQALELQETAERVIAGCAGPWPVEGCWSAEGAPVVTALLRISNRIGDIDVTEQDAELKEDACYLVLWHQAAVDRALRLAYSADVTDASEHERAALQGLGAPSQQLRDLYDEVRGRIRALAERDAAASGTSTQNSFPSTSASTTQETSPWPTSAGVAPSAVSRSTSSA